MAPGPGPACEAACSLRGFHLRVRGLALGTGRRRPASLVVVRTHKPKFVPKERERCAATEVLQASPPELPIERGLAGPGLLADTIVRRWQDHLPLHRLERIYGREGLELARSTIGTWHAELAALVEPLIDAMWEDALSSPYLCTDATGVLVQANEKCRRGHFVPVQRIAWLTGSGRAAMNQKDGRQTARAWPGGRCWR